MSVDKTIMLSVSRGGRKRRRRRTYLGIRQFSALQGGHIAA